MDLNVNILITFQELPENCAKCKYCIKTNSEGDAYCLINNDYTSTLWEDRHVHCPIIKGSINILEPHNEKQFDEEKFYEILDDEITMRNIENLINNCLDNKEDEE